MTRALSGGGCVAYLLFGLWASVVPLSAHASASRTLDALRAQGSLSCGVVVEQEDFNKVDTHGDLSGFSARICGAVAAAALGDAGRVRLEGYPDDAHGIAALEHGTVALLVGTTPEATMAMLHHLRFSPTLFVDGQGFLIRRSLHAKHAADLRDRSVCFLSETPAQPGLTEWQAQAKVPLRFDPYEEGGEMEAALTAGHCDAITADVSALAVMRAAFHGRRAEFEILPWQITFDPFAAATREADPAWTTIVSDVVAVLIEAEQRGIDRAHLSAARSGGDPAALRLLGPTPGLHSLLGLQDGWAARAVAASGNYREILDETVGAQSPLGLPRGRNSLWSAGGMIGAPAFP